MFVLNMIVDKVTPKIMHKVFITELMILAAGNLGLGLSYRSSHTPTILPNNRLGGE